MFCNVTPEKIISNPDLDSIYELPMLLEAQEVSEKILTFFDIKPKEENLQKWKQFYVNLTNPKDEVRVGLVGKYFASGDFVLSDAYISVIEAIKHASAHTRIKVEQVWINSEQLEKEGVGLLDGLDGIVVPQGWGSRGSEGKILAITFARESLMPYLGLCYGMQMAAIEFGRTVLGWQDANSEEVDPHTTHPVIHVMPHQKEYLAHKQYGGTIRLGSWPCLVKKDTMLYAAYHDFPGHFTSREDLTSVWHGDVSLLPSDISIIRERHRHRYEFNNTYKDEYEKHGFIISGTSPDGELVEAIEVKDHPFFVGTQFHPELQSRPLDPHPLFVKFVQKVWENK
jgi:CTP synthase